MLLIIAVGGERRNVIAIIEINEVVKLPLAKPENRLGIHRAKGVDHSKNSFVLPTLLATNPATGSIIISSNSPTDITNELLLIDKP
ncbi:hypothetical protein AVI49_17145 (plasmid) [Piscirickettsia salmonis]|nr:hypothetical protein [Piscirickettsia salmonis]APS49381.1 hypothetical protein AVI49_17145 [Piscirickettsia salmonis]